MTRNSGNPRAPESSWKTEFLRLTTFHAAVDLVDTKGWWRALTGTEPDSIVDKPKGGERAEIGNFEEWQLVLQVQTRPESRVDWMAGGLTEIDENQDSPLLDTRLPLFIDPLKKWLGTTCPETKRLALGAVVILDVSTREEGYRTCSNYLEFDLDPKAFDFNYQINRKRSSGVLSDVVINRLSRWSVGARQTGRINLQSGEGEMGPKQSHCRLELDINTDPETTKVLPHHRLNDLLDELVGFMREIIREGDIP